MEEGYTPNKIENYPLRAYDSGKINGFNFYAKIDDNKLRDMDRTCQENPLDVNVVLHHPAEVHSSRNFFTVPFNKSVTFTVTPQITKTSESLRNYEPSV
jgi:hypothetical protein